MSPELSQKLDCAVWVDQCNTTSAVIQAEGAAHARNRHIHQTGIETVNWRVLTMRRVP
jgi:hypothetical protein